MNTIHTLQARRGPVRHSKAAEAPVVRLAFTDSEGVHHRACVMSTLRIDAADIPDQLQDEILHKLRDLLRLMSLNLYKLQSINTMAMELRAASEDESDASKD